MWWILFIWGLESEVVLARTHIFNPLTIETAARRHDGAFFLFDRFEQEIWLQYPVTGERRKVARQGMGPGELDRTNRIMLFGEKLYAITANKIHVFSDEGEFQQSIRLPAGLDVVKTASGWVGQKMRISDNRIELAFYNHDLSKSKAYVSWEEQAPRMSFIKPGQPYRPVLFSEMGNFIISEDGKWLYYRLPEKGTIHIVSTAEQAEVGQIELERRFPFDQARGDAVVADIQKRNPNRKVIGVFPEHFPYTNGFHWDPRGFFVAAQYQGKHLVLLRFRPDGTSVAPARLTVDQFERIIAVDEHSFFVSYQNSDHQDMGVRKISQAQATAFFEAFPLEE